MPIRLVRRALRAARSRSAAITSASERAAGTASSSRERIDSGTVWSSSSSSDLAPITSSMCPRSRLVGSDVAVDELVREVGERDWHGGLRTSRVPIAPALSLDLRASPGAVAGLSPSVSPFPLLLSCLCPVLGRAAFQRCLTRPVSRPERLRGCLLLRRQVPWLSRMGSSATTTLPGCASGAGNPPRERPPGRDCHCGRRLRPGSVDGFRGRHCRRRRRAGRPARRRRLDQSPGDHRGAATSRTPRDPRWSP